MDYAKVFGCPNCDFKADGSRFKAFEVGLAQNVKDNGLYLAPKNNTPMRVCPKCGIAFLPV